MVSIQSVPPYHHFPIEKLCHDYLIIYPLTDRKFGHNAPSPLIPPSPFVLPVAQWDPLSLIPYFPNQNICKLLQFSKEFHLK